MSEPGRVDFYVLPADDPVERLHFACRLVEKVYLLQQSVHVHTGSAAASAQVDDLLWTFRQGSFVPHQVLRQGEPVQAPVTIGHGSAAPPAAALLINLSDEVPGFATGFARVAEIVDATDANRRIGREHFRHYRESGRKPETHEIGGSP